MTADDLYREASALCRHYSDAIARIRTLAQHVFIAYAVGSGIAFARSGSGPEGVFHAHRIIAFGGLALAVFGSALWVLNLHLSRAFDFIRDDFLVDLERRLAPRGPWTSHAMLRRRSWLLKELAWHGPFAVIVLAGAIGALLGFFA